MTYNGRGQTFTHTWARGVKTTFGYDSQTGELLSKTYDDGTPSVAYTYTRAGLLKTVTDVTGQQTLDYATAQLQRLRALELPAYYGSAFQIMGYDSIYRSNGFSLATSLTADPYLKEAPR